MLASIMWWLVKTLAGKIILGIGIAAVVGYVWLRPMYWEWRAYRAESQAAVAETKTKMKDVEIKYAPKIIRMQEVARRAKDADRRTPAAQTPEAKATDLVDAAAVADTINGMWGRKSKGRSKP